MRCVALSLVPIRTHHPSRSDERQFRGSRAASLFVSRLQSLLANARERVSVMIAPALLHPAFATAPRRRGRQIANIHRKY